MITPVHIVQLSFDKDVFSIDAPQDSRMRQISYAKYLNEQEPGAELTNIVLTADAKYQKDEIGSLTLDPQNYYRLRHIYRLYKYLRNLHKQRPIAVLTTQDIHGIFWAGLLFGRLSGIPVVAQHHCDLASSSSRENRFVKPYGRIYERIALFLVKAFDGVRVVNSAAKEYLQSIGYKKRIEVLPVQSVTFPVDRDEKQNNNRDTLRVLFAGRFVKFKNLECWIRTAALSLKTYTGIEFYLIGDGKERDALEMLCNSLELNGKVHFLGALPPRELAEWYANADVFLLTSVYEGFGRVVVEAMNYGMVPVCSDVSGPRDIIQHGVNGYLAKAEPEALSELIVNLAKDPDKRNSMKNNALITAKEKYAPEKLRKEWLNFLLSFVPDNKRH